MKPIEAGAAHEAANVAHRELMEHEASPAFRALQRWLDARLAYKQGEMLQARPDNLERLQIEAQTLERLRQDLKPSRVF